MTVVEAEELTVVVGMVVVVAAVTLAVKSVVKIVAHFVVENAARLYSVNPRKSRPESLNHVTSVWVLPVPADKLGETDL